ncbi:hypothetical protein HDU88_001620 [Geranomyces variabilis]|nr:hypothetical protein HDU88_001620 [Geranomyces variabilis]
MQRHPRHQHRTEQQQQQHGSYHQAQAQCDPRAGWDLGSPSLSALRKLHSQNAALARCGLQLLACDPPSSCTSLSSSSQPSMLGNARPPPRLLGGADPASTLSSLATTLITLTGASPEQIGTHLHTLVRSSPHTTLQIVLGSTLHVTHMLGLTPYRSLLFHPRLFLAPRFQLWRGVTAFGVVGLNVVDVLRSAVSMVYWQAPLERWFDGEGDVVRDGVVVRAGRNRTRADGSRKGVLEWLLLDNRYLRAQLLAGAVVVAIELVLYKTPTAISASSSSSSAFAAAASAPAFLIYPYSLYPSLEHAVRWLWAMTTETNTMTVFGVLPVRPVYLPLALCALGGFAAWKEMLKGLVAAVVVGKLMDLRRRDGENATDWLQRTAVGWVLWARRAVGAGGNDASSSIAAAPKRSIADHVSSFIAPSIAPAAAQPRIVGDL